MVQLTNNDLINQKIQELVRLKLKDNKKDWKPGIDWVQYSGSYFTEDEYVATISTLLDGWLALGEDGIRFENKFSPKLGKQYGILTNSGSSANLLMISALKSKNLFGLKPGSKIITPVAGFPTTINPIIQNGFEPVFIDIELDTLNLDIQQLEEAAKQGASALIFAHVLANSPNMDDVMSIVKKYGLILLEDCCDALGSSYDGKPLGSFGEFASCSFYPAHHMTMGEGGFVACNTKEQEIVLKSLREWGRACYCSGKAASCLKNGMCKKRFSNWLPLLPNEVFDHKYVYNEIGYNLKPLELQASMGLVQLEKLDWIIQRRKYNFSRLLKIFQNYSDHFTLPKATEKCDPAWFAFPLTLKQQSGIKRTNFTMFLEEHKIQTRNYFGGNVLLQPAYSEFIKEDPITTYPNATIATQSTFFLGTSPVITDEHLDYIESIVNKFFSVR
jgi:CDP-6-deoxy-D-xylo-4-hexulose-3-dehydrase